MCRMLIVRGEIALREVVDAAVAMSLGKTADHERREDDGEPWVHRDGWGLLALDAAGDWQCARDGEAVSATAAKALWPVEQTNFAIAHLRKASDPQYLGLPFSHPVEVRRNGRTCYFFHNGYAPDVGKLIGKPEGWDTERLLEYLLPALGGDLAELQRKLDALPASTTSANFIFVEGTEVTVGNWYPKDTESPRYYALRVAAAPGRLVIASDPVPSLSPGAGFSLARNGAVTRFNAETPAEQIVRDLC